MAARSDSPVGRHDHEHLRRFLLARQAGDPVEMRRWWEELVIDFRRPDGRPRGRQPHGPPGRPRARGRGPAGDAPLLPEAHPLVQRNVDGRAGRRDQDAVPLRLRRRATGGRGLPGMPALARRGLGRRVRRRRSRVPRSELDAAREAYEAEEDQADTDAFLDWALPMFASSDQLLSEFIGDWNAGRRPDVRAYLKRVPAGAEREELACSSAGGSRSRPRRPTTHPPGRPSAPSPSSSACSPPRTPTRACGRSCFPPCASDRGCRWRSLRVSSPSASASACRSRADRGLPRAPRAWRARDLAALAPPARRASDALGRLARTTGRRRRLRPRPAPGKRRRHAVPPGGRRRRLGGRRLRGLERGGPRAGAGRGARRGRPALPRRPGRLVNRRLAEQPHDCVRERRFCLGVATQHGVQAAAPQRLGGIREVVERAEAVGERRAAEARERRGGLPGSITAVSSATHASPASPSWPKHPGKRRDRIEAQLGARLAGALGAPVAVQRHDGRIARRFGPPRQAAPARPDPSAWTTTTTTCPAAGRRSATAR